MKCLRFMPAMCVALALGAATMPARADDNPPATANTKTVAVYKQGKQYVVAVYRPDGSETLALVDAPHVKPAGNGGSGPDIADLMKNGKVTYSIDVAAGQTPEAQAIANTMPKPLQAHKSQSPHKLTAKDKAALKRFTARVAALDHAADTIGKAVAHASPPATDTTPSK